MTKRLPNMTQRVPNMSKRLLEELGKAVAPPPPRRGGGVEGDRRPPLQIFCSFHFLFKNTLNFFKMICNKVSLGAWQGRRPPPPLPPVGVGGGPTPTPLNFLFVSVSFSKSSIFYQNDLHQGSLKNLARPSPPPLLPGGWRGTDPPLQIFCLFQFLFKNTCIFFKMICNKASLGTWQGCRPPSPPRGEGDQSPP